MYHSKAVHLILRLVFLQKFPLLLCKAIQHSLPIHPFHPYQSVRRALKGGVSKPRHKKPLQTIIYLIGSFFERSTVQIDKPDYHQQTAGNQPDNRKDFKEYCLRTCRCRSLCLAPVRYVLSCPANVAPRLLYLPTGSPISDYVPHLSATSSSLPAQKADRCFSISLPCLSMESICLAQLYQKTTKRSVKEGTKTISLMAEQRRKT